MKKQYAALILMTCMTFFCCAKEKVYKSVVNEKVDVKIPEYKSNYVPYEPEVLPEIHIKTNDGQNDFIIKPVSAGVTKQKTTWGEYSKDPAPWYTDCSITVVSDSFKNFSNVPAKVRVRGNWTSNYAKKPLRIHFEKKQSILGLNNKSKFNDWILLASYKDWSFLRDSSAYYIYKLISSNYGTDFQLVNVYINDAYWGVYILAEQQEIDSNRVNIRKMPKDYKGTDIGYLLEMDGYAQYAENSFYLNYYSALEDYNKKKVGGFINGYTIKSEINDESQKNFVKNYLQMVWKICYEAVYNKKYYKFNADYTALEPSSAKTCYECVSEVIDLNSLLETYLLQEICCDADIYWSSFYMDVNFDKSGEKRLVFEAPWDFDSGLGNKRFCADSKGLYAAVSGYDVNHEKTGYGNPWLLIFINCSWFQEMIRQKWTQIYNQQVYQKVVNHIDFVTTQYEADFEKNYSLWKNCKANLFGVELCSASAACKNQKQAAEYLKTWLTRRFDSLNELWLQ